MDDKEDDQEVCRVCRCEATEEEPLFYPCKCSGSIRYVHQNCLHEWLVHSKREHCELCGHSYAFTPVYQPDMPATIPFKILLQQIIKKAFTHFCLYARFTFVSIVWFIILPYCTVWATRFCLWTGPKYSVLLEQVIGQGIPQEVQQTATTIVQSIASATSSAIQPLHTQATNLTAVDIGHMTSPNASQPAYPWLVILFIIVSWFDNRPYVRKFFMDCSEGQSLVFYLTTVTFFGFMARNWVMENMPADIDQIPENLEDLDLLQVENINPNQPQNEDGDIRDWLLHLRPQAEIPQVVQPEPLQEDQEPIRPVELNVQPQPPLQDQLQINNNILQQAPVLEPPRLANPRNQNEGAINEENALGELFVFLDINGELVNFLRSVTALLLSFLLILVVVVWIPYLVGITFILSSPTNLVQRAAGEIRFMLDMIKYGASVGWETYFEPMVKHIYQPYLENQHGSSPYLSIGSFIEETLGEIWHHLSTFNQIPTAAIISYIPAPVAKLFQDNASLADTVYYMGHQFSKLQTHFHNAAFGHSQYDQLLCIGTGHLVFILGCLAYLSRKSNVLGRIGRGIKIFLRQQVVVFKLIIFLFLDMVTSPWVCGIVLNISMSPFIPTVPLSLRWELIRSQPLHVFELHWLAGYSIFLGLTKTIIWFQKAIRPGAAWFMENFDNRERNIFREIPEQPIITQLWRSTVKLLISSILIFSSVGGTLWCIHNTTNILPLRRNFNADLPNLESCIILLMYITIPHILKYYQAKKNLHLACKEGLAMVCHRLRLSSYILGNRVPEEEGTPFYTSWFGWVTGKVRMLDKDGQLALVPSRNSIKGIRGRRMLVPVDPNTLQPLDDEERRLGHPANTGLGGRETNSTIVYLPPGFKTRIAALLAAVWISIIMAVFSLTLGPVALGYLVLTKILNVGQSDRNDIYSYCTGIVVALVFSLLARKINRAVHLLRNRDSQSSILQLIRLGIHDTSRWALKTSFLALNYCIISPVLIGIIFELYTHIFWTSIGSMGYRIPFLTLLERGLGLLVVIKYIYRKVPNETLERNWNTMFPTNDIRDFDIPYALRWFLGPLILVSTGLIGLPFLADCLGSRMFGYVRQDSTTQWAYSISLMCIILALILRKMAQSIMFWVRSTREDVFMLRRDLNNFDGNQQEIER
ncbi:hypothetical protein CLU79DRAFT_771897 [Phycomyces nitens]|nr:hypothetical protein CLU79DRAFT_771897 [Phycomyces nitens]